VGDLPLHHHLHHWADLGDDEEEEEEEEIRGCKSLTLKCVRLDESTSLLP
jgi:hypothetical protein